MAEKSDLQKLESAVIIQRNFRKYLQRKRKNVENKKTAEKSRATVSAERKTEPSKELGDVRNGLQSFYRKVFENADRDKYIDDLISETDKISDRLKNIGSLQAFGRENVQIREKPDICNEAKKRHEEKLRQLGLQWWEKLNLPDNDNE